jgi:hypothetical protein
MMEVKVMQTFDFVKPYVQIEDKHGAVASVYYMDDLKHMISYSDNRGVNFFLEEFDHVSIELVEKYAMEWALGKRELNV